MEHREMATPTTPTSNEVYKGYPTERLVLHLDDRESLQNIEIPKGPWCYSAKPEASPSMEQSLAFIAGGYETDSEGRPLHPWARQLLSAENGGAVVGKGAYWYWGPNRTADPIIITTETRPRILLIERSDTRTDNPSETQEDKEGKIVLALPGGFVDPGENAGIAALREAKEETGLELNQTGIALYEGPVNDPRATLNAWPETAAYLFTVSEPSKVVGSDDARSAGWYYLDAIPYPLYGSHAELINLAIDKLGAIPNIYHTLALQAHEYNKTIIQAGHMAYEHSTIITERDALFIKAHDATRFDDPEREKHSRGYLVKEHQNYRSLEKQGFAHIPARVGLISDTILGMDYLDVKDGWQWRAPDFAIDRYLSDVLRAFDDLQQATPLESPQYHTDISPTYETFWREGWDAIDDDSRERIKNRVLELSNLWDKYKQEGAHTLYNALDTLQQRSIEINRTPAMYMAHNDARQSNIAWHPEYGVKIVDWSWADVAPKNADATMFLIDLAKSGHDVSAFIDRFNPDFAITLIGFWLAHSIWQTRDGSTTVREHQVASATTAFELLARFDQGKD